MRALLAASLPPSSIIFAVVIVVLIFSLILVFLSRFRRCPSDKVMVIYGRWDKTRTGPPDPPAASTAVPPSLYRWCRTMNIWT